MFISSLDSLYRCEPVGALHFAQLAITINNYIVDTSM